MHRCSANSQRGLCRGTGQRFRHTCFKVVRYFPLSVEFGLTTVMVKYTVEAAMLGHPEVNSTT